MENLGLSPEIQKMAERALADIAPKFREIDEIAVHNTAKVMAASAIDALEDPEIIRRAKEELLRRTGGKTYQPPIPAEIQPKIPRDLFQTP